MFLRGALRTVLVNVQQAGADLAISTWDAEAPLALKEEERRFSETVNVPSVGCDGNYMFPALQMNVAQERGSPSM